MPSLRTLERAGLAALLALTLAGFAIYPSWPNYDTLYALVWARELVHLHTLSFEAFRAPTEHPLAIAFGVLLQPLGDLAPRAIVLATLLAFVAAVAGVYRLSHRAFTPLVGLAAALILLSRFDFGYLAIRAYIDIPYVALLVWAAVLEYERPRRGGAVFALLTAAALLRPEAWPLIGVYFLWMALGWRWRHDARQSSAGGGQGAGPGEAGRPPRRQLIRWACFAAAGPLIWAITDLAVSGDPFFSFHATGDVVSELGRGRTFGELPAALYASFTELVKPPVLLAGGLGLALAVWFVPKRVLMPAILLFSGIATFVAIGVAGLAVIDRYLVLAAVGLCIFAGFTVGGFGTLRPGWVRWVWAAGSGLAILFVVAFTLTRTLQLANFNDELVWRSDSQASLERVLAAAPVRAALRHGCGPISTPTHKLIPNVRWSAGLSASEVIARSDPDQRDRMRRGLALYAQGRQTLVNQGFDADTLALTEVPPPGFRRIATDRFYTVFARCPGG